MNQEVILLVDGLILMQMIESTVRKSGLDFESVCSRAGITGRTLDRYAKGSRWPSVSTIKKLNQAYMEEMEVMKVG